MGGGEATAAGLITGLLVYAIDPAGVHPATIERVGPYSRETAERNVQNFVADGEILDCVQQPHVQRAVLVGLSCISPAGAGALAVKGRRAMAEKGAVSYGAAGPVYKYPILVNATEIAQGKANKGMSPGLGDRLRNGFDMKRKIELHDPDYVIAGMEQQKADDLLVMDRML